MSKTHTRLTEDERYQIYEGVTDKRSHREIASLINRHHSTVSREIKRNTGFRGYRPNQANVKAKQRHKDRPRHVKLTSVVQQMISENIKKDWSPEQVQGRLKAEGLEMVL